MRFLNKYKIHEYFESGTKKLPLRVLKLKRPKWAGIKRKLKFKKFIWIDGVKTRILAKFSDPIKNEVSAYRKVYASKLFRLEFQSKRYLKSLYDSSIKWESNRRQGFRKEYLCSKLIKPLFYIDTFLWYLNFFPSSWTARQVISSGYILVNEKPIKLNYIIKEGDIIQINLPEKFEYFNRYQIIRKKFKKNRFFFPFLEYDYYTNTFIVLKDLKHFSRNDLILLLNQNQKSKFDIDFNF